VESRLKIMMMSIVIIMGHGIHNKGTLWGGISGTEEEERKGY
jgi:hypothetical protein